ncbi:membrane protein US29 [Human betaherpesvirus 5]|nr:membrane protein US29 [Human betaherpesvirus 5]
MRCFRWWLYSGWWWLTFGCARTVTVGFVAPTVRAQSTVVRSEPAPPSETRQHNNDTSYFSGTSFHSSVSPATSVDRQFRRTTYDRWDGRRWLRTRYGNASACVTGTQWSTNFFFSQCEHYPSFVKLNGVQRWTPVRRPMGEVAYYGGCCMVGGGNRAYVILVSGYGTASYGNALRVDFGRGNCTAPKRTYPRRLELHDGRIDPSRCDPYQVYFYGLQCSEQLVITAHGGVGMRRCPTGSRPTPSRPHRHDLENELHGLCVDLLVCVLLLALLLLELVPMEAVRHPLLFWRRVALSPSTSKVDRAVKLCLRRMLGLPPPPSVAPPGEKKELPAQAALSPPLTTWSLPPFPSTRIPDSPPPPYQLRHATSLVTVPTLLLYTSSDIGDTASETTCVAHATYGEPPEPARSTATVQECTVLTAPNCGIVNNNGAVSEGQDHGDAVHHSLDVVSQCAADTGVVDASE